MNPTVKQIIANLPATDEGAFKYYDLAKSYDVTLNFIQAKAKLADHTHDQTVYNYVMDGEFEVTISNETKTIRKGEWIKIPKNQAHAVVAKTETTLLELWEK